MTADRFAAIGSEISRVDADGALDRVRQRPGEGAGGYVCFTNVHAAVTGCQEPAFQKVTNGSFLSLADGKPVYWLARLLGDREVGHVPGPDFMLLALDRLRDRRHFFYGSTTQVLELLKARMEARFPGLQVCGTLSPPFRTLTAADVDLHHAQIRESGAEYVWVGLGAPKQEMWMSANASALRPAVLFGVGAAFEFHSGVTRRAPVAMRRLGLEWLFRLAAEPRRLWKRYLVTNTLFVTYVLRDLASRAIGQRRTRR
jgi:N-acetylglucosaminyldiphosphoundecaprenol N-acetyl-beta-D-mannosaminyltransferase